MIPPHGGDLRWSVERRLRFVDERLFWEARVNRGDLVRRFGISVPQAAADLKRYQELAPANLAYDRSAKSYVTTAQFEPLFGPPAAEEWLAHALECRGDGTGLEIDAVPVPRRDIDPWCLRRVLAAARGGLSLAVLYQPMDEPKPGWRWISPRALATDGARWHVRAFNHGAARWEDLVFARILEVGETRPVAESAPPDADWERRVVVRLRPAARLSDGQKAAVAQDYGMVDGVLELEIRAALLFLTWRRLGLDRPDILVEAANRDEIAAELARLDEPFRRGAAGTTDVAGEGSGATG